MLDALIACLESARKRPAMYLGRIHGDVAYTFLNGFHVACFAAGVHVPYEIRQRVTEARGRPWSAASLTDVLRQRGLDESAIVDDLFAIEIEAIRALRDERPGEWNDEGG